MAYEKLTLREKIEREQKRLDALLAKKEDIERKIQKSRVALENYRLMENDQKLTAMSDLAERAGISVEDIFSALQNGELNSLQEKMEAAKIDLEGDGQEP